MAWEYGFFNSVNGDRVYNAQQMSSIFEGLITDGVYESVANKLAVQPSSGMTIQIASGRGWFNKHWVNNDTEYLITLEASDVTLNRYAAICIRVDDSDGVRSAVPYVKYSTYATNPTKPTMTRTETLKEYCLAYVYIKAGAGAITTADIEDTRPNRELCGWVTGLIEQLNSTTLWSQWEALFSKWFSGLQDLLNENTEAMLVAALPTNLTLTLKAEDWVSESGVYKQNITVTGMNETKSVLVSPTLTSSSTYSASEVRCSGQSINTLEFTAVSQPNYDIEVDVLHLGV
jgi:hypothetical protein